MIKIKTILRLLGLALVLFVTLEVVLSLFTNSPKGYYIGSPNSKFIWPVNESNLNGIDKDAVVEFDKYGTRSSKELNNEKAFLVFGGSTAACSALSLEETWPYKLEQKLGENYWLGNVGRDGINSYHHVLQVKHILKKEDFKNIKYAIFLIGINDFLGFIGSPDTFLNQTEENLYKAAFSHVPNERTAFYRSLATFKFLQKIKRKYFINLNPKAIAIHFKEQFRKRKQANKIDSLPNLSPGLNTFKENIIQLINISKKHDVYPIFVQQTSLWNDEELSENEQSILSGPIRYTQDYFSTSALSKGLKVYNKTLKEVCTDNDVMFVPLSIPKSIQFYYDDIHYNRFGTELVSDSIYNFLKEFSI